MSQPDELFDGRRHGLPCRWGGCSALFAGPIPEAALSRNAHEDHVHAYVHKIEPTYKPVYSWENRPPLEKFW